MIMARLLRHALTPWLWLALAITTSGCAVAAPTTVAVPVTAVNYTGTDLNGFLFIDVNDPDKVAGGSGATPYSGTGAMCCYALPLKWHPGIQVKLRYDFWNGSLEQRDYKFVTSELPPYPTGEPGALWALLYDDGSVQVIASAVDPGHPKWPGKINHWPIPSREYRLKLWQMDYDEVQGSLRFLEKPLDLSAKASQEDWDVYSHATAETKAALKSMSGPTDPAFVVYRENMRQQGLESMRAKENLLLRNKP